MNIYLCGMIGSGKTTLGERLAAELGMEFRDLDREMDRILGYSFHRLVEEKGWVAFRELEYDICKRFAGLDRSVIALGGGTVRYRWNVDVLRGTGLIVLLEASVETLVARVKKADRPRVNPGTTLEEDVRKIWEEAGEKYRGAADLVVRTDQKGIDEGVKELKGHIEARTDWIPAGDSHGT
jgi:shikimate kinase